MNYLTSLNSQQKEAVYYTQGPSLILAGAGSGKTRTLIAKVYYLINEKKVKPKNILMITFTNKAAEEMKKRIGYDYNLGFVGTFHSFSAKILRVESKKIGLESGFIIYDEDDQISLIKRIIKESYFDKNHSPHYYLNKISLAKNQLISPKKYIEIFKENKDSHLVYEVYLRYEKELKKNNAVDFDDLLNYLVILFQQEKAILDKYQNFYRYIFVDEFQDTNFVQYQLTRMLAEKYQNLTVVGDFSQSIYSWRGARFDNLNKIKIDFPSIRIYFLKKNYRSTQTILDFAYQVISKNQTHPILHLKTDNEKGEEVYFYEAEDEREEAIYVAEEINRLKEKYSLDKIAVLYRVNAQSRIIEEVFLKYQIPYLLIGGIRFYERKEIKDIISYLRLLKNPNESVSLERAKKIGKNRLKKFFLHFEFEKNLEKKLPVEIINDILKVTDYLDLYDLDDEEDLARVENINELKSVANGFSSLDDFLTQISLVESEYFDKERQYLNQSRVRLMTLHQAKGLEFEIVFIIGVEEGILPHLRSLGSLFELEEERRLFYVGITRAKKRLYISYTNNRYLFGFRNLTVKSRFLDF